MKRHKSQKPSSPDAVTKEVAPVQEANATTLPLYLRADYIKWHRAAHTYEEHYATYKDLIPLDPPQPHE